MTTVLIALFALIISMQLIYVTDHGRRMRRLKRWSDVLLNSNEYPGKP
jgi:hypothetical protein